MQLTAASTEHEYIPVQSMSFYTNVLLIMYYLIDNSILFFEVPTCIYQPITFLNSLARS